MRLRLMGFAALLFLGCGDGVGNLSGNYECGNSEIQRTKAGGGSETEQFVDTLAIGRDTTGAPNVLVHSTFLNGCGLKGTAVDGQYIDITPAQTCSSPDGTYVVRQGTSQLTFTDDAQKSLQGTLLVELRPASGSPEDAQIVWRCARK